MTVCIAAICSHLGVSIIVGASDRLVTFGDVEYEQTEPKILKLASQTVALIAGSPEDHTAICQSAITRINVLTYPTVKQIGQIYAEEFGNLRRNRAEQKYLTPLGLSLGTFLSNQTNLNSEATSRLADLLESERLRSSAIIAGCDQFGAHLYVVRDPGEAFCYDLGGWAAIGYGNRHADLQFMAEKYHPRWPFEDAFLLTYLAKKKADITPGVGVSTDLFWITPGEDKYVLLEPNSPIVVQVQSFMSQSNRNPRPKSKMQKGR